LSSTLTSSRQHQQQQQRQVLTVQLAGTAQQQQQTQQLAALRGSAWACHCSPLLIRTMQQLRQLTINSSNLRSSSGSRRSC
jgi:hypothetical protein